LWRALVLARTALDLSGKQFVVVVTHPDLAIRRQVPSLISPSCGTRLFGRLRIVSFQLTDPNTYSVQLGICSSLVSLSFVSLASLSRAN
jgi:hypothetical protein